jgi:restriction system protein
MLRDYAALMSPWSGAATDAAELHQTSSILLRDVSAAFERVQRDLRDELLRSIYNREPAFFENLVIDVLLALGYGGRRRDLARCLGRSGDGGVDGVISTDELGLDQVYVQAKRIRPSQAVPIGEVRDFAGSLDAHRATKGVFVTTSHFSQSAVEFCKSVSRRVAMVDGQGLADMMIRHNIGVVVVSSYQVKQLDPGYFRPRSPGPRNA